MESFGFFLTRFRRRRKIVHERLSFAVEFDALELEIDVRLMILSSIKSFLKSPQNFSSIINHDRSFGSSLTNSMSRIPLTTVRPHTHTHSRNIAFVLLLLLYFIYSPLTCAFLLHCSSVLRLFTK